MVRKLIKLTVFLLIVNALYRVAPAWVHYYQFRDAVQDYALFSKDATDAAVVDRVMTLADEYSVPLMREYVQVIRDKTRLSIEAPYVEPLKVVPGYVYNWQFNLSVEVWHADGLGPVRR